MRNVLFYIPNLDKNAGGIYQYSLGLLEELVLSSNNYYVYLHNNDENYNRIAHDYSNVFILRDVISESKQSKIIRKITNLSIRLINKITRKKIQKKKYNGIDALVNRYSIDIIHCPYQNIIEGLKSVPQISTMHDVQELHFPEYFNSYERMVRAINHKKIIDNSDAIIVSYNHIKEDIHRFFLKDNDLIHVFLLNMSNLWINNFLESDLRTDINIYDSYILYPAATWEHKNHISLINALKVLNDNYSKKVNLICTGHKTDYYSKIESVIIKNNLMDQVKFLGVVDESYLYNLYMKSEAVVVPTKYEAGSFPLMESIICGKNTICSDITSLPETIGNTKYTFNPNDNCEIAEKIYRVLFDRKFKKDNHQQIKLARKELLKMKDPEYINEIYDKAMNGKDE